MIELLDPRKIASVYPLLTVGWSYRLDYNWTLAQSLKHGGNCFLDVGCGKSQLGPYIAKRLQAQYTGVDRQTGQGFADYKTIKRFDIIAWVSSLEHNSMIDMRLLYLKSMDLLKPGGLFLATVTVAQETGWFEPSANTNLSPADILTVFDEAELVGDFADVHQAYQDDKDMMERYKVRYRHFDKCDPLFIIAGVAKIKKG